MFYIVSKTVGFFAIPSNLLIVAGVLGALMLRTRFSRAGRRLMLASALLLGVLAFSPLGHALIWPLEDRFPKWDPARGAPDGIVVLGGMIDGIVSHARDEMALNEASERLTAAVALARRYPQARLLFSGGTTSLVYAAAPESAFARRFFAEMGLPAERLLMESAARNSSENAAFSKRLADPQPGERWLLVTSAYHMPRSIGIFRRQGFPVEAFPVDWRSRGEADLLRLFPSASEGLRRCDVAIREWVGLAVYWLTGRTSALFPGPE